MFDELDDRDEFVKGGRLNLEQLNDLIASIEHKMPGYSPRKIEVANDILRTLRNRKAELEGANNAR